MAARLTEKAGASDYVKGGIVVYSNEAKIAQAGVPAELIERHGAVSAEVAQALAAGARKKLGADVGVGVTGVAGPGGGTEEKPVGLVWLSVATAGGVPLTRSVNLPGSRADVRDRATTVAMHLLRRALFDSARGEEVRLTFAEGRKILRVLGLPGGGLLGGRGISSEKRSGPIDGFVEILRHTDETMCVDGESADDYVLDALLVQVLQQRYWIKGFGHGGRPRRSGWQTGLASLAGASPRGG